MMPEMCRGNSHESHHDWLVRTKEKMKFDLQQKRREFRAAVSEYRKICKELEYEISPMKCALDDHDCGDVILEQISPTHYRCKCGTDIRYTTVEHPQSKGDGDR